MHDNVLSTEDSDTVRDVERDESPYSTEGDTQGNDHNHPPKMPLGVELTGYRLITSVILAIGIPVAVYSYKGQVVVISRTLGLLVGISGLILFWLGVIEAKNPGLSPGFFQVDLAPSILRFLRRPEVYLWFLSAYALLLNVMHLRRMLDDYDKWRHSAYKILEDAFKHFLSLSVISSSTAICVFCMHCLRVIWPRVFRGTRLYALLLIIFIINSPMWLAYYVYAVVNNVYIGVHKVFWAFPITLLLVSDQLLSTREGYFPVFLRSSHLMMAACIVLGEALVIEPWIADPDDYVDFYGIFFSCCLVVFFLYRYCLFVSVPTSWIPSFAHTWSAKAAYDRFQSVGNKAWAYVLGIGRAV